MTPEEYAAAVQAQNGVCAICGKPETSVLRGKVRRLAIDHNHATGVNRDLLCSNCNRGLGFFLDSPTLLEAATAYLRRHGSI